MVDSSSIMIGPSLLAADPLDLRLALRESNGADFLHVDLFDGAFVRDISWGPRTLRAITTESCVPVEVHLMVSDPRSWAEMAIRAGCAAVIVHVEAFDEVVELSELAASLRCAGVSPGVAISPETPVDLLSGIVTSVDTVVVMTVEPGLGGSPMIGDADGRVREVREIIRSSASTAQLEVDGGMNAASIGNLRMLGVRRFVVGSAVFGSPNPRETIKALKRIGMERDAEISDYNIR